MAERNPKDVEVESQTFSAPFMYKSLKACRRSGENSLEKQISSDQETKFPYFRPRMHQRQPKGPQRCNFYLHSSGGSSPNKQNMIHDSSLRSSRDSLFKKVKVESQSLDIENMRPNGEKRAAKPSPPNLAKKKHRKDKKVVYTSK